MEWSFAYHDLKMDVTHTWGILSFFFILWQTLKTDHHLLKFYLSESCKILNNSQLDIFCHRVIWKQISNIEFFSHLLHSPSKYTAHFSRLLLQPKHLIFVQCTFHLLNIPLHITWPSYRQNIYESCLACYLSRRVWTEAFWYTVLLLVVIELIKLSILEIGNGK